jgi:hypothetical protein
MFHFPLCMSKLLFHFRDWLLRPADLLTVIVVCVHLIHKFTSISKFLTTYLQGYCIFPVLSRYLPEFFRVRLLPDACRDLSKWRQYSDSPSQGYSDQYSNPQRYARNPLRASAAPQSGLGMQVAVKTMVECDDSNRGSIELNTLKRRGDLMFAT